MTTRHAISVLRGRDRELGRLTERVADALAGRGSLTVVEGVPGIGKTRLVGEAATVARRGGAIVAQGAASSSGELTPLGVLARTLAATQPPIAGPELMREARGRPDERLWLLDRLSACLEDAALRRAVVVVVDDLQWADPHSVVAIAELAARLAGVPVAWVLATRPDGLSPAASDALATAPWVRLAPLDAAAVAAVTRDAFGAQPGSALLAASGRAGGNAHALRELLEGLREEALVAVADGRAELRADVLPARVRESMRVRLARLSASARAVAVAAATLGRRAELRVLGRMLDRPVVALGPDLAELDRAGLLERHDRAVAFPHDLVHQAVLETLTAEQRRALGRRAVDALLDAGAGAEQVAARLHAVAEHGDRRATALLLEAARAIGTSDAAAGAELARRGFELCAAGDPSATALAIQTTLLLHASNRAAEARVFARRTLGSTLSGEEQAQLLLSVAWLFNTAPDDQVRAGREALGLRDVTPATRARHLRRLVVAATTAGRAHEATLVLDRARSESALLPTDPEARFETALAEIALELGHLRFGAALPLIDAAERAAAGEPAQAGVLAHWRVAALHPLDRSAEALALIGRGVAAATAAGQAWDAQLWDQHRGLLLLELGRPADALATLEGRVGPGEVLSGPDAVAVAALARAAVHVGDDGQLRRAVGLGRRLLSADTPELRRVGALLALTRGLAVGDRAGVRAALPDLLAPDGALAAPIVFVDVALGPALVRAALLAADRPAARAAVAWQAAVARRNPGVATLAGAEAHARGLLADDPALLEEAAGVLAGSPRRLARASALEDLGAAHARAGATGAAAAPLDAALGLYADAGAAWDARRVRRRLRRVGIRRVPRPAGGRATAADGLTATESAVVRLAAEGLTNREIAARLFLSPHTVSTHVRHVFAKLGVRSRVELARSAAVRAERDPAAWARLTPTELRVAELVGRGMSNAAAAQELVVARSTVATHLHHVYGKLGVRTRAELARAVAARPG